MTRQADASNGPLDGVKVVSIEQAVAAPLCARHLRDVGADVVKIERVGSGDFARQYDSVIHGESSHFVWLNHGKKSIALDLKKQRGVAILRDLLETADVLVSNLGPGALDRIIDDETMARDFPKLIRCFLSGYGPIGPFRDRKAFDLLVQGEAGITLSTGTPESPAKAGVSLVDLAGGSYAVSAIALALYERTQSGRGRRLDISLFDVMVEWISPLLLTQAATGRVQAPAGMHHSTITPYGPYKVSGGGYINIAVQNESQWRRLCDRILLSPGLADDPRYATNEVRLRNRAELESRVQAGLREYTLDNLSAALDEADIPWGNLNDVASVLAHPQLQDEGRWLTAALPGGGSARVLRSPFRLMHAEPPIEHVPAVGEHTLEILQSLGYSIGDIRDLERDGVVSTSSLEKEEAAS